MLSFLKDDANDASVKPRTAFAKTMDAKASTISEKVDYVKSQGQTRNHHCHWPGCTVQVPPAMWGCKRHWYMIPSRLRHRIWMTYRHGQEINATPSREYIEAARQVQDWIKHNYPNG